MTTVPATVVERDELPVLFVPAADELDAIRAAWDELERQIGSLRGRRFFGTFDPTTKEYRASVEARDDDGAAALGLEPGTIAGGTYLRTRLRGEPPDVYERIAPTFAALAQIVQSDDTRASIEFYRRRDEIDLLLPVRSSAQGGSGPLMSS